MKLTPMLEQYLSIKEEAPDALLLFRMGDFYEFFLEDAKIASRELQITLTCRNPSQTNKVEMCGVPWHSVDSYIATLVKKGYTVAVCDQIENPKEAKGIVKRGITRILTPGTLTEEGILEAKENNFLAAAYYCEKRKKGSLAWVDVSTGKWAGFETESYQQIQEWIHKIGAKELLFPDTLYINKEDYSDIHVVRVPERGYYTFEYAIKAICKAVNVPSLESMGLERSMILVQACGALLTYLHLTQKCTVEHLQKFQQIDFSSILIIDEQTEKNLELCTTIYGKKGKGTLLHTIDATKTSMGGRYLEERVKNPYRDIEKIRQSQEAVEYFVNNGVFRKKVQYFLEKIEDIERVTNRILLQRATPKDFISLKYSLQNQKALGEYLQEHIQESSQLLFSIVEHWDPLEEFILLLEKAFVEPAPVTMNEGGIFKKEYSNTLQELIHISETAQEYLSKYIESEQIKTQSKLKLTYTKNSGYSIEISKNNKHSIPENFIRKQSLVNAERYTSPELLAIEEKILNSEEERKILEQKLLQEIYKGIRFVHSRVLFMSSLVASVDFLQSCAEVAVRNSWSKPNIVEDTILEIEHGRHPIVEDIQGRNNFIANGIILHKEKSLAIITGPNMGGKSTFLRQTAILCILAQMGSYIPASSATIGIVDKIFCRVGASDNLSKGQSTFMVEMIEASKILRNATPKSLLIIDEIGRGTSTFDGLAIAWAIVEELAKPSFCARTLFATHYHELPPLEQKISTVFALHFGVKEENGTILFLKKILPGPADKSYGIEVAKLAGIPSAIVARASTLLRELEKTPQHQAQKQYVLDLECIIAEDKNSIIHQEGKENPAKSVLPSIAEDIYEELQSIKNLDIYTITPLRAFEILTTLWNKVQ